MFRRWSQLQDFFGNVDNNEGNNGVEGEHETWKWNEIDLLRIQLCAKFHDWSWLQWDNIKYTLLKKIVQFVDVHRVLDVEKEEKKIIR